MASRIPSSSISLTSVVCCSTRASCCVCDARKVFSALLMLCRRVFDSSRTVSTATLYVAAPGLLPNSDDRVWTSAVHSRTALLTDVLQALRSLNHSAWVILSLSKNFAMRSL